MLKVYILVEDWALGHKKYPFIETFIIIFITLKCISWLKKAME